MRKNTAAATKNVAAKATAARKNETYVLSQPDRLMIADALLKLETNEGMHLAGKILDATAVALARSATH